MSRTFLEKITHDTRENVRRLKDQIDVAGLRDSAFAGRSLAEPHRLQKALRRTNTANIIAEIKRASPSKGVINSDVDIVQLASAYRSGGAVCISVLTEPHYFHGSMDDLRAVRAAVDLPILRKDFIVDAIQVFEAAAAGADAILLIVAALTDLDLNSLFELAHQELRMDVLVEVHSREEMEIAAAMNSGIIGINNRDLHSLEVSLQTSRRLIDFRPRGSLMVAESGISTQREINELRGLGFDGFLIGEALMQSTEAGRTLETWI